MDEFELPETPETPESHKERTVGLIIAAIAVVLAIVTHVGNETSNEKILAHVDASDQFAFYQAKKQRHAQLDLQNDNLRLFYDRLSPEGQAMSAKLTNDYAEQSKHLEEDGKEIKAKGDELLGEAKHLEAKGTFIELGEIGLQIAVVLCSITILTKQGLFARMGMAMAAAGVVAALWGLLVVR